MIVDVVNEQKGARVFRRCHTSWTAVESSSVFKLGFILFCEITQRKLS